MLLATALVADDEAAVPFAQYDDSILRIAYGDQDQYPFEYFSEGAMHGFHIELIDMVAAQSGYQVQHMRLPWKRILKMVNAGELDGVSFIGGANNLQEEIYFDSRNALSVNGFYLMIDKNNKAIKFHGKPEELADLTIAVIRGYDVISSVPMPDNLTFIEVDTEPQLYSMLKLGRVDAALVMRSQYVRYQLGELKDVKIFRQPLFTFWVDLGFSKRNFDPEFLETFAQNMVEFTNTADYQKLQKKYLSMQLGR